MYAAAFARTKDPEQVIGSDLVSEEVITASGIHPSSKSSTIVWLLPHMQLLAAGSTGWCLLLAGSVISSSLATVCSLPHWYRT
jgi:hypothetical protein